jgi:hypothetical protein
MLIAELDEGREALLVTARDAGASAMLQQRAAECLANAWPARIGEPNAKVGFSRSDDSVG